MTSRLIFLTLACLAVTSGRCLAQAAEPPPVPPVTVVAVPDKSAAWVVDSMSGEILDCVVKSGVTFDNITAAISGPLQHRPMDTAETARQIRPRRFDDRTMVTPQGYCTGRGGASRKSCIVGAPGHDGELFDMDMERESRRPPEPVCRLGIGEMHKPPPSLSFCLRVETLLAAEQRMPIAIALDRRPAVSSLQVSHRAARVEASKQALNADARHYVANAPINRHPRESGDPSVMGPLGSQTKCNTMVGCCNGPTIRSPHARGTVCDCPSS